MFTNGLNKLCGSVDSLIRFTFFLTVVDLAVPGRCSSSLSFIPFVLPILFNEFVVLLTDSNGGLAMLMTSFVSSRFKSLVSLPSNYQSKN